MYRLIQQIPKSNNWKKPVIETHGACTGASGAGGFEVGAVVGGFVEAGYHTEVK